MKNPPSIPLRVFLILLGIEIVLVVLHATFTWPIHNPYHPDLIEWVNLNREGNLPTWFSSMQFALLSLVMVLIHRVELNRVPGRRLNTVWIVCAALALYLSADEASAIHELAGTMFGDMVEQGPRGLLSKIAGIPSFYWPVVYLPIVIPVTVALGVIMWKELGSARKFVILGVLLFLAGSVIFDNFQVFLESGDTGPPIIEWGGELYYFDIYVCEEFFEMFSVSLILLGFLKHLMRRKGELDAASSPLLGSST